MIMKKKCIAIVLSAGQGRRMGTAVQKQYIELEGKPVIYYTLKAFEDSAVIDEVVLVVGQGQEQFAREEIVDRYEFTKVSVVIPGGKERYDSVWEGLKAVREKEGYIFIHDGARMFVDDQILRKGYETVKECNACAAGMPSKDTIKIVDERGFVTETPQRKYVWTVQTPQIFENSLITEAYSRLMREECIEVTDDAMVVEQMMKVPVRLFEASYENIKITTPEDLKIAAEFLKNRY